MIAFNNNNKNLKNAQEAGIRLLSPFVLCNTDLKMIKKYFQALVFLLMLFILPVSLQAQESEANRAARELQEQHHKSLHSQKAFEREQEFIKNATKKPHAITSPEQNSGPLVAADKCFAITKIEFLETKILSEKDRKKLSKNYLNKCLTFNEINNLLRETTVFLTEHGFTTTRVSLPEQDLRSKTLKILVRDGIIEEIILNENSPADQMQVRMAFPSLTGKILNIREIEQGLDQMNRLASNNATVEFLPGTLENSSKVIIKNKPNKTRRIRAGYDNTGQKNTGRNKALAAFDLDNLLKLNDQLSLVFNRDTDSKNAERGSELRSLNFSVPYGRLTLALSGSVSEYSYTINDGSRDSLAKGNTYHSSFKTDYLLMRTQHSKLSLNSALTLKDIRSDNDGVEIQSQTQNINIFSLGGDFSTRLDKNFIFIGTNYNRGIKNFGAHVDESDRSLATPSAQFNKYELDLSLYRPFKLMDEDFTFKNSTHAQYSHSTLFPSEKISIGDRNTVRGFHKSSLSGDSGVYNRSDISWKPDYTLPFNLNKFIETPSPYLGLDFGSSYTRGGKAVSASNNGYVSGAAVGLRASGEYLNFDLAFARHINKPYAMVNDSSEVYFSVGSKFGF